MLDLSFDISSFNPKYMKKYTLQCIHTVMYVWYNATGTGNKFPVWYIFCHNYAIVVVIYFSYFETRARGSILLR